MTTPIDVPILPNTQLQGAVPAAGRNLNVAAASKMLGYPDRATDLANVAFIGAANDRAGTPRARPSGLGLTLGYNRGRDRVFAHWALADGIFSDRIFADRRGGCDRLRPWEVGSNCCSHISQRHSANDHEFQHRSPLAAEVILELT